MSFTHLNAALGVLLRTEEEGAVDQRIAIEHQHRFLAQDAGDATLLVLGERRQDEQTRLVVAMVALVLHLSGGETQWECTLISIPVHLGIAAGVGGPRRNYAVRTLTSDEQLHR